MYLQKILETRRSSPSFRQGRQRLDVLRTQALSAPPPRDFLAALRGPRLRVIAEIKRASPSRGPLCADLDPAERARAYEQGGAAALSVLTEPHYFQGSLDDLRRARAACSLPVLRKDFLLEPWEIYESRAAGADAILLIAAALAPEGLGEMLELARNLGMEALVEVHDEEELRAVLPKGPRIIGINNRDLATFQVDLETTRRLAPGIPPGVVRVSESGISSAQDVERLGAVDAVLVGEALVGARDPRPLLTRLTALGAPQEA
ncbi:MAG TPA: indole-3-glycerol phosphate synthase TrpC [Candidatus Nitrosotenuis sp.]|jgi:indole-3-glycerol phosphate synthase|nr:indole-3-glycerol phosphate synthase TrpC [Candidatus Nitrosotenuis sp.]